MPPKQHKNSTELITKAIYAQIENEDSEENIIATINGNAGLIDFSKKFGLFKDTLLMHALSNGLEKVTMKFIDLAKKVKGVDLDVNHKNEFGDYALLIACKKHNLDAALALLDHGATLCEPDQKGYTPLLYASQDMDMYPVVERILQKKMCKVDHVNDSGDALSTTLLIGNPEATKLLIDYYLKNDPNNEVFLKNVEEICKDKELVDDIKKIYSGPEHEEFIKTICGDVVQAQAELVNPSQENKERVIQIAKPVSTAIEIIVDKEAEEVPTAFAEPIHGDPDFNASDPDERGILQPKRLGGKSKKRKGKKGRKTKKNKKRVTKKNKRKMH